MEPLYHLCQSSAFDFRALTFILMIYLYATVSAAMLIFCFTQNFNFSPNLCWDRSLSVHLAPQYNLLVPHTNTNLFSTYRGLGAKLL